MTFQYSPLFTPLEALVSNSTRSPLSDAACQVFEESSSTSGVECPLRFSMTSCPAQHRSPVCSAVGSVVSVEQVRYVRVTEPVSMDQPCPTQLDWLLVVPIRPSTLEES